MFSIKKIAVFAAGTAFGSAGFKLLTSKDAKKVYSHCTAAALRVKDFTVKTATNIQENAEDILAEAKQINKDRECSEDKVFDDLSEAEEINETVSEL